MRRSIFACGLLLALAGIPSAVAAAAGGAGTEPTGSRPTAAQSTTSAVAEARSIALWTGKARRARGATVRWLTVVRGRPPRLTSHLSATSAQGAESLARYWQRRATAARQVATHPPAYSAWNCIHRYEGSWTDPNAPYWGGLQMDYSFQSTYGAWFLRHEGTADHWTPLEQIWAAVRAWRLRGFEPWANTAHMCGVY